MCLPLGSQAEGLVKRGHGKNQAVGDPELFRQLKEQVLGQIIAAGLDILQNRHQKSLIPAVALNNGFNLFLHSSLSRMLSSSVLHRIL